MQSIKQVFIKRNSNQLSITSNARMVMISGYLSHVM